MTRVPVRAQLARLGLAAHRSRGQNFLVDPAQAERIVEAAGVSREDAVLEIGTGLGLLTQALARRAGRVLTVEVDAGLVRALREAGELPPNVELRHADVLELDLGRELEQLGARVQVVASLPYSISSPVLRSLLDVRHRLRSWVVLLQREMALRILAPQGSKDYGSLAVLHHLTVRVERVFDLPPGAFHPRPRVVSTLVRVIPLTSSPLRADELSWVERVVRVAFGQRRKTLVNALRAGLGTGEGVADPARVLEALSLASRARAEELTPEELLRVARGLRGCEE